MTEEEKKARYQALGWMHAEACCLMDRGEDIREIDVSELIKRAVKDLDQK